MPSVPARKTKAAPPASLSYILMRTAAADRSSAYRAFPLHSSPARSISPSQDFPDFPLISLLCCCVVNQYIITGFAALYLSPLPRGNHGDTRLTCPPSAPPPQVPQGRLHGGGEAQRLPGHRLPPLPRRRGAAAGRRALRALHGGARGLRGLPTAVVRSDAMGVRPPVCPARPGEVLREVPALYPVYVRKGVSPRRKLLLHL